MKKFFFKHISFCLILIGFLFLTAANSFALREIKSTTHDLARSSDGVVLATCLTSEAKIDEDTGLIFTYTTFRVDESIKGEYGEKVVLRIVGGTVGDMSVSSPYLPVFTQNDEVILFLGPYNTKGYPVLQSIQEGIYSVETDDSGVKYVSKPVSGLDIIDPETHRRVTGDGKVKLDDFIYSINEVM